MTTVFEKTICRVTERDCEWKHREKNTVECKHRESGAIGTGQTKREAFRKMIMKPRMKKWVENQIPVRSETSFIEAIDWEKGDK